MKPTSESPPSPNPASAPPGPIQSHSPPASAADVADRLRLSVRVASARGQSLKEALSAHASSLRDDLDAWRASGHSSASYALAQANVNATPGGLWHAYHFASAPWRFVVNKAAATFGSEVLLVSITLAHCIAAGAALVAAPVVYLIQSECVRRAATEEERRFQRERRIVGVVALGTIPVSFTVATSNSWRCYAADDDHTAVAWVIGVPLLHCSVVYGAMWTMGRRWPGLLMGEGSDSPICDDTSCTNGDDPV